MIYHYRNSKIVDEPIVKLELTYTPKPNENADLENICKELEHTKISLFKTKGNLHTLRKGLDSLIPYTDLIRIPQILFNNELLNLEINTNQC